MKEPTICLRSKNYNIDEALKILTDEWVDDGNYSAQTVIDLRDALKYYIEKCEQLQKQIDADYWVGDIL
jgi:hypothetical protein